MPQLELAAVIRVRRRDVRRAVLVGVFVGLAACTTTDSDGEAGGGGSLVESVDSDAPLANATESADGRRSIEVVDAFPLSGAGKVLKRELRKVFWGDATRSVN